MLFVDSLLVTRGFTTLQVCFCFFVHICSVGLEKGTFPAGNTIGTRSFADKPSLGPPATCCPWSIRRDELPIVCIGCWRSKAKLAACGFFLPHYMQCRGEEEILQGLIMRRTLSSSAFSRLFPYFSRNNVL